MGLERLLSEAYDLINMSELQHVRGRDPSHLKHPFLNAWMLVALPCLLGANIRPEGPQCDGGKELSTPGQCAVPEEHPHHEVRLRPQHLGGADDASSGNYRRRRRMTRHFGEKGTPARIDTNDTSPTGKSSTMTSG